MHITFPSGKHTRNILTPSVLFPSFVLRGEGGLAVNNKNVVWNHDIWKYVCWVWLHNICPALLPLESYPVTTPGSCFTTQMNQPEQRGFFESGWPFKNFFFPLSLSLELTIWPGYLSISAATAAAASDFSACSQAHPAERWGNELCQKLGILTGAGAHTHLNT